MEKNDSMNHQPLVSVVIIGLNQGKYISTAISSVLEQTHPAVEVLVVDDGSTDNTHEVAERFSGVRYYFQQNSGISAARNKGIQHARGEYLVFLDADDWLLPEAVERNLEYMLANPSLAFVSGAHKIYFEDIDQVWLGQRTVEAHHYIHLLQGNYIGMVATVLFRKDVVSEFLFDESLPSCEDYDLYFRIAKRFPVLHHKYLIAVYRKHDSNMSGDFRKMMMTSIQVLEKQEALLEGAEERDAFIKGRENWIQYYTGQAFDTLRKRNLPESNRRAYLALLKDYHTELYQSYLREEKMKKTGIYQRIRRRIGSAFRKYTGRHETSGPIAGYNVEKFLLSQKDSIHGLVLEVGTRQYAYRFGSLRVRQLCLMQADGSIQTVEGKEIAPDLESLPGDHFDCILLSDSLQKGDEFRKTQIELQRILKPGGRLLTHVTNIVK